MRMVCCLPSSSLMLNLKVPLPAISNPSLIPSTCPFLVARGYAYVSSRNEVFICAQLRGDEPRGRCVIPGREVDGEPEILCKHAAPRGGASLQACVLLGSADNCVQGMLQLQPGHLRPPPCIAHRGGWVERPVSTWVTLLIFPSAIISMYF